MSTPRNKIPILDSLFHPIRQDATRVSLPKTTDPLRDPFLPPDVNVPESHISPVEEKGPSSLREAFDYIRSLGIDMPEQRDWIGKSDPTKPASDETSKKIGGMLDFVSGELEAGPGAIAEVPFAGKLVSRLDKAIEAFPQSRATGKQWLASISKGVPEQESSKLKEMLNKKGDIVLTKEQVLNMRNVVSPNPQVDEVIFGAEPVPKNREIVQESENRFKIGEYEIFKLSTDKNWQLYDSKGKYMGSFQDLNHATRFAQNMPNESLPSKWSVHVLGRKNIVDYSEIVLTLPGKKLYKSSHWDDIDNPISHLRMGTRSATSKMDDFVGKELASGEEFISAPGDEIKLEIRQIEELQSDWAQSIRKEGAKKNINDLPDVNFGVQAKKNVWDQNKTYKDIIYSGENYRVFYDDLNKPYSIQIGAGPSKFPISSEEDANNYIKAFSQTLKSPDMPFSNTDQWVDLSLERAIQDAIDRDIDVLTWTPAQVQYELTGSELVKWKFVDDTNKNFRIQAKNQYGGALEEIGNLEELAAQRGMLIDVNQNIRSQEDLEKIMLQVLQTSGSQPAKEEIAKKQAAKIWKRMQSEPEGFSLPRKEGNEFFYDQLIPRRLKEVAKKNGFNLEMTEVEVPYDSKVGSLKQQALVITKEMKEIIKKNGWAILGATGALGVGEMKKETEQKKDIDSLFD
jgi:hypothetical protein